MNDYFQITSKEIFPFIAIQTTFALIIFYSALLLRNIILSSKLFWNNNSLSILLVSIFLLLLLGTVLIHDYLLVTVSYSKLCIHYGFILAIFLWLFVDPLAIKVHSLRIRNTALELKGKLKNDYLEFTKDKELIYIKTKENYCELVYEKGGKQHKQLFRISMKELEKQLIGTKYVRVHKSYIVDTSLIDQIKGNANNSIAFIKDGTIRVPIARSKREKVLEIFNHNQAVTAYK